MFTELHGPLPYYLEQRSEPAMQDTAQRSQLMWDTFASSQTFPDFQGQILLGARTAACTQLVDFKRTES